VNKPENEKSIRLLTQLRELDTKKNKNLYNTAISALEQPTATEFLQKAKAMKLQDREQTCFSLINYLYEMDNETEANLVRKVMDYQITPPTT
jgi:hypothetical protein